MYTTPWGSLYGAGKIVRVPRTVPVELPGTSRTRYTTVDPVSSISTISNSAGVRYSAGDAGLHILPAQ